jgi:hypothetical protein
MDTGIPLMDAHSHNVLPKKKSRRHGARHVYTTTGRHAMLQATP